MDTYAERLKWAMSHHSPPMNQSDLARAISDRIDLDITPQSIQHLCDAKKNAKGSNHNSIIAEILSVDPVWLAYNIGSPNTDKEEKLFWPFTITPEQYQSIPREFQNKIERYIEAIYIVQSTGSELSSIADIEEGKKISAG